MQVGRQNLAGSTKNRDGCYRDETMARTDTASRRVRADAATVYRALLDPEVLRVWLPPDGMRAELDSFDARVGGGYRMSLFYDKPPATGGNDLEPRAERRWH